MLSDTQILHACRWRGLVITPFSADRLQAASYDVTLHPWLWVLADDTPPLDPKVDTGRHWSQQEITEAGWVLPAGCFALGSTSEQVTLPVDLVAQLEGKSSLGRLGLMVHSTAGFLDPGFTGQITLELSCVTRAGVVLYPNMPIGQIALDDVGPVERPYAGKYVSQSGPTLSRYHENWNGEGWK